MNTTNKTKRTATSRSCCRGTRPERLSRRDAQRVEEALASDPELARRYALVREELGETILLNETLGAPSARAMETLFAKIDAEPARKPAPSLNLGARIGGFFASLSPRTLAWSASAAAIAILLQAGLIAGIVLKEKSPRRLRDRLGAELDHGRRRLHPHPLRAAGQRRRHHQVSRSQQTQHRGRTDGRRALQGARC